MSLRKTLRKAAGLLVELPPESEPAPDADLDRLVQEMEKMIDKPKPRTVEQIVRDAPGPNLDEIKLTGAAPTLSPTADGKLDFTALYQGASLPGVPFTAEQMLEMLASLPAELSLESKRQTVRVTLKSMGASLGATAEGIVADASRKIAALTAYAENLAHESAQKVAQAELEIARLQTQVEEKRKEIEAARAREEDVTRLCESESGRLDDVLEFFSLDVPPSKYAPQGDT